MMCVLDQDLPSIVPKKGEVVLEVKAAAVNFPDILILQGKYQFKVDTKHELCTAEKERSINLERRINAYSELNVRIALTPNHYSPKENFRLVLKSLAL